MNHFVSALTLSLPCLYPTVCEKPVTSVPSLTECTSGTHAAGKQCQGQCDQGFGTLTATCDAATRDWVLMGSCKLGTWVWRLWHGGCEMRAVAYHVGKATGSEPGHRVNVVNMEDVPEPLRFVTYMFD